MKESLQIIQTVVFLFFAIGGGYWLSSSLKKNAAQQRNEHLKSAMVFASQGVIAAQSFFDKTGEQQEEKAINILVSRLKTNNLLKFFTQDQINMLIKEAYGINKANGSLDKIDKLYM